MNLIERLHRGRRINNTGHDHPPDESSRRPGAIPPFLVRHYDLLWRVLSRGRTDDTHEATLVLADYSPTDDLLDIGCGTGALVLVAEERFGATGMLVGLDVEGGMIAKANAKADHLDSAATFAEATMTSIPYQDESFDVVTSSLMLHHVPEDEHLQGFRELHRVLRPQGRIVVADINLAERSAVSRLHGVRRPTEDTVQRGVPAKLEAAGFRVTGTGRHSFKALSYVIGVKAT